MKLLSHMCHRPVGSKFNWLGGACAVVLTNKARSLGVWGHAPQKILHFGPHQIVSGEITICCYSCLTPTRIIKGVALLRRN